MTWQFGIEVMHWSQSMKLLYEPMSGQLVKGKGTVSC